jgi:hypothetical protein
MAQCHINIAQCHINIAQFHVNIAQCHVNIAQCHVNIAQRHAGIKSLLATLCQNFGISGVVEFEPPNHPRVMPLVSSGRHCIVII